MSNSQVGSLLPVGSVLVFAGNETTIQKLEGWLVCDGSEVKNATHQELFDAIGYTNGGNGTDSFLLPDYRGYFLRGVDQGAGRDPNANTRTIPASLGNSGDYPGSIQGFATALPATNPFAVPIPHVPTSSRIGNTGALTGDRMAKWNSHSTVIQLEGGAKETRPKNKYVYFIIKSFAKTALGEDVPIPAGAVVPIAGTNTSGLGNKWLKCNGSVLDANAPQNQPLYDAIGVIHGGDGHPSFFLPDYRGYFLRGVSGDSRNDPDATNRFPPQGNLPTGKGASGNNVGSMQYENTAQATNKFTVTVTHLPTSEQKENVVSGHDNSKWEELPQVQTVFQGGGDESRPINAYVDWYIKAL